ncbi:MAG: lipid A biosynthesis acyltransferase [Methylococcaceae bacterium]|nr:lipid A biosynthesis acyltransferase [Methylococcaceae bacterium]
MSHSWTRLRERSSDFWLSTIVWIALRLGRPVARALLYPIAGYFLLHSDRSPSIGWFRRVLGRPPTWKDLFRHYLVFSETILDRVFVFAGRDSFFKIEAEGIEVLERYASSGRGCLLVGAHLGSFEILRALGRSRGGLNIKALAYGENSPKINAIFRRINPQLFTDVIEMGSPAALLGVDEQVSRGGIVALLGDRSVHGEKRVLCDFFGEPAWFPASPVLLGSLLKVPVVLFYCLRRGNAHYQVHFELLGEDLRLDRARRNEEIAQWMQRYADRLEHYSRLAPENWFNFYDFWDRSGD